jgi:hypothetical protein
MARDLQTLRWLTNRRGSQWRDKSGIDRNSIKISAEVTRTNFERARRVAFMLGRAVQAQQHAPQMSAVVEAEVVDERPAHGSLPWWKAEEDPQ